MTDFWSSTPDEVWLNLIQSALRFARCVLLIIFVSGGASQGDQSVGPSFRYGKDWESKLVDRSLEEV